MSPPLVSIISPVYNQERYVAECIESVRAQTYQHWEQIFVDDGSSDGTRAVIEAQEDPRIRLVTLPHRGLGALAESYNAALAVAHGSLVGILEGDDAWPAHKLERQVPLFDDARTLLSWGRGVLIDSNSRRTRVMSTMRGGTPTVLMDNADAFHRLTLENFFIPSVSVMVRRQALDTIGGFRQTGSSLFVDLPTWLWLTATHDGHVTYLDEELGIYRHHAAGTSTARASEMKLEHLRVVRAVEGAIGPDALARVRWDARSRRRASARGGLVKGKVELAARHHAEAYHLYREALFTAVDGGTRVRALRGMLSAGVRGLVRRLATSMRPARGEAGH
ncbi:MAG TPA: glycosyltransferase family 2 protein [Gemmatimonadaceae bacterium]|nr:glycosyltransferase family 2 protein [Gemmatimonadaceae bacterium]